MSDYISRQAAIDEAKEWIDAVYFEENDKRERKAIECFIGSLKNMPSAQPEQRWIPCSEMIPPPEDMYQVPEQRYLCQLEAYGQKKFCVCSRLRGKRSPFWDWYGVPFKDSEVVAWMPLPEPWKEKPNEIH